MKYQAFIFFEDGRKLALEKEYDSHDQAEYCALKRLEEIRKGKHRVVIAKLEDNNDRWRKLYNNWWRYRLIKMINKNYKVGN